MNIGSIEELLQRLPRHFRPERAVGMDAVVQLRLGGEQGGDWYMTIRDQRISVTPGVADRSNLTIAANAGEVLAMLSGEIDPMRAYMQGKIKMSGDLSLASQMANLFKMTPDSAA